VEIDALIADGIQPTPRDIVLINALAWNVETPDHRRAMSRGTPVNVNGVSLWPLTLASHAWYRRVGCNFRGGVFGCSLISQDSMRLFALAYAMAFGRSRVFESGATWSAIAAWAVSLPVRSEELVEAVSQIIEQDQEPEDPPSPNAKPMSAGALSAFLVARAGGSPEMWERYVSGSYVSTMFNAVLEQARADGDKGHDPAYLRANRALGWYCERIRKRGK
jgi:hypothetical protein